LRNYNLGKEIKQINIELASIYALRETIETRGWKEIVRTFNTVINRFMQDIYNKCDDPGKHQIEIKCKRMTADALGAILSTIDARVKREDFLQTQLQEKTAKAEAIQKLRQEQL